MQRLSNGVVFGWCCDDAIKHFRKCSENLIASKNNMGLEVMYRKSTSLEIFPINIAKNQNNIHKNTKL